MSSLQQDLEKFKNVDRKPSGFPVHHEILKDEEASAKSLHRSVCKRALEEMDPSFHAAIAGVAENPSFPPRDLEWIAQILKVAIRCTCCAEARAPTQKITLFHEQAVGSIYFRERLGQGCKHMQYIYLYAVKLIAHERNNRNCTRRSEWDRPWIQSMVKESPVCTCISALR